MAGHGRAGDVRPAAPPRGSGSPLTNVVYPHFDAPGGSKRMHRINHHTYKPGYVGRVRADGQFDILWRSRELVDPQAFSPNLRAAGANGIFWSRICANNWSPSRASVILKLPSCQAPT